MADGITKGERIALLLSLVGAPEELGPMADVFIKYETALKAAEQRIEELDARLRAVTEAKALAGVRKLVAGWNGEDRPEGPHTERHPARLGARIETNCGAIYALDEALTNARATLKGKE